MNDFDDYIFGKHIYDTGSHSFDESNLHSINVKFDKFIVTLLINEKNEFVKIESIEVKKDFLNERNNPPKSFHDVEEFYIDD